MTSLPLHGGKCPAWLFTRMKVLGAAIIRVIVENYGAAEVLRRMSDPYWFQALGCVLGFDWHSSGVTTTVCGALKEGLRPWEGELGLFLAGGKGKTSRRTPQDIVEAGDKYGLPAELNRLQDTSRLVAKVDTVALQDGYQLYHHFFVFTRQGEWAVVQQGMSSTDRMARRYHWLGETAPDPVCEPHAAVCCDRAAPVLNLVAKESGSARDGINTLAREERYRYLPELRKYSSRQPKDQLTFDFGGSPAGEVPASAQFSPNELSILAANIKAERVLNLPRHHAIPATEKIDRALLAIYERQPENFQDLLLVRGVGPATVRALALAVEVIFGAKASYRDPVRYSFAHGGKDGYPYPVDRLNYERTINSLEETLRATKTGDLDKMQALKRLAAFAEHRRKYNRTP